MPSEPGAYTVGGVLKADTICLGWGDESKLGDHCRVLSCPRKGNCVSKEKTGPQLVGWSTGVTYACRKCVCNAHNALTNRHGVRQTPPTRDLVDDCFGEFAKVFAETAPDFALHPMLHYSTWLGKWPEGKRRAIETSRKYESLLPKAGKAMVKWELGHKPPTKARLIQFYRNLATQSEYAPSFTAAQKVLCTAFNRRDMGHGIDVTIASGMTANDITQWMRGCVSRGAVAYYERDGKTWDATMGEMHSRFKTRLYEYHDPAWAAFVKSCECAKFFVSGDAGMLRYSLRFTVKSGHNDTTLGNGLVNAAIAFSAFKRLGIRCSIIVAGDDLLVACYDPVECAVIVKLESEYGIVPEARVFARFDHASFISGVFLNVRGDAYFVPSPGRLIHRLWWTMSPPHPKRLDAYRRGVALGLLPVAAEMPILRVFLRKFEGSGAVGKSDKGYVFRGSDYAGMGACYDAFEQRYGLSKTEIDQCEDWLEQLPAAPLLLRHDVLTRLCEVDQADVAERCFGL